MAGWDSVDVRCGGCGMAFTGTSQADVDYKRTLHREAHSMLDALRPDQRRQLVAHLTHITRYYDRKAQR